MARLRPFSPATCPHCRKKETRRIGYSAQEKGSIWQCIAEGCKKLFTLPLLALTRKAG